MKVRIVRAPQGRIDGIDVDLFYKGIVYDLAVPLASLLICEGYAELADGLFARSAEDRLESKPAPRPTAADRRRCSS